MAAEFEKLKKKKRSWPYVLGLCVLLFAAAALIYLRFYDGGSAAPTLTVETPQRISLSQSEEFSLDVSISDLGEAPYPAASMSISFDSSRLEFLGLQEGNVFVYDDENGAGIARQLPDWSCNVAISNDTGLINIMYLDMSGGKYAFGRELLAEEDNVLLRLRFRLRGSLRPNDVLDIIVEDAVFAASDESQSLAMTLDTLKTRNGRVVVGE